MGELGDVVVVVVVSFFAKWSLICVVFILGAFANLFACCFILACSNTSVSLCCLVVAAFFASDLENNKRKTSVLYVPCL